MIKRSVLVDIYYHTLFMYNYRKSHNTALLVVVIVSRRWQVILKYKNNKFHNFPFNPVTPKASGWKDYLFSRHDLGYVEIEEVAVEDGLNNSSHNRNDIIKAFVVVAVDPIEDVKAAIRAQSEEIVACDCLGLAGLADHEELGKDGNTL